MNRLMTTPNRPSVPTHDRPITKRRAMSVALFAAAVLLCVCVVHSQDEDAMLGSPYRFAEGGLADGGFAEGLIRSDEFQSSDTSAASGNQPEIDSSKPSVTRYSQTNFKNRNYEISLRLQLAAMNPRPPEPTAAYVPPKESRSPAAVAFQPPTENTRYSAIAFSNSLDQRLEIQAMVASSKATKYGPLNLNTALQRIPDSSRHATRPYAAAAPTRTIRPGNTVAPIRLPDPAKRRQDITNSHPKANHEIARTTYAPGMQTTGAFNPVRTASTRIASASPQPASTLPPSPLPAQQQMPAQQRIDLQQRMPAQEELTTKTRESNETSTSVRSSGSADVVNPNCVPNYHASDFSPTFIDEVAMGHDQEREAFPYDTKYPVPTQYPLLQYGRYFYGDGITPKGKNWFGETNLVRPQFYLYGDYRTGIQAGRNAGGRADNWAHRLNLDMDLRLTDTERFHAFVGPLDEQGRFTRYELVGGDLRYRNEMDWTPATAFFEGDLGVITGAMQNKSAPFDLPVTFGLVPLLFQNGIWMEDAVTGVAASLPAKHSRLLNWSNFDATFFAVFDQINSPAFVDDNDAQAFGTAWFIEAYDGYIETGYAYLRDRSRGERSYHNMTMSYTRRYFHRISNSIRVIVNAGQDLPKNQRTADGALLLVENSWITPTPLTVVPYANFFAGFNRPQSVARAGISGGILRNTGINFDTDGLNGFATLDPTGADTAGFSLGMDLIGSALDRQLLVEFSYLTRHGSNNPNVPGDQFGAGTRYQFPISNATLIRMDAMYGWREQLGDVYGTRIEYRWKF